MFIYLLKVLYLNVSIENIFLFNSVMSEDLFFNIDKSKNCYFRCFFYPVPPKEILAMPLPRYTLKHIIIYLTNCIYVSY